jgi:3'-phosphoadenosine 5'-phosphosulfate sulfotransferase (PAPS reductase)/FAD synthetase
MFSGGIGSWAAAKRVVARFGQTDLTLLFADTLIEDEDLYRFLREAADNVGAPLVRIADGRTPWQVYRDERFLGNSRADPCSKLLKRVPASRWLRENCDPRETVVYVGIDWTEEHRFLRTRELRAREGWSYKAPLCEPPYLIKRDMFAWLLREGIKRPRLYDLGFAHNNCGGFCCKAGQGHFSHLLRTLPDRYSEHEEAEEALRKYLRRNVAIMADRRGGDGKRPLSMRELRTRIENGRVVDPYAIGGCGCFSET